MLEEGGYRCGLFTSPHLVKINERFQINEVMVSDQGFLAGWFLKVKALADELVAEGDYHPTYFEFLFLMGMLIFDKENVDYLILETGLGGKLDATNSILHPLACVITSISLDHVEYLGDTVEKIAGEKAGIIKAGVPVTFDGNVKEAAEVLRNRAEELGCPWYEMKGENQEIHGSIHRLVSAFLLNPRFMGKQSYSFLYCPVLGLMNAALALETMGALKKSHELEKETLIRGIAHTKWQGRMETILPGVIVDGAHNEDGIARFVETVQYFQGDLPLRCCLLQCQIRTLRI